MSFSSRRDLDYEQLPHHFTRLLVIRLLLVTLLSGTTLFFQLRGDSLLLGPSIWVLWWLVAASVFASFIFYILRQSSTQRWLPSLALGQLAWDVFFTTGLVYVTGATQSIFTPLYCVNIALGAIVLGKRFGYLMANLCLLVFGFLMLSELYDWLPPMLDETSSIGLSTVFAAFFINMGLFNVVAYVLGYFIDRLQRVQMRLMEEKAQLAEMKQAVQRNEQLAAVGRLAAAIAHEIRNPLTSISGSIEMLRRESMAADSQQLMDIVLRETQRLNQLIGDFLEYARPTPPTLQAIYLQDLVDETLQLFKNDLGAAKIQVEHQGHVLALIDPAQMRQVFWNLLKNAHEANDGSGSIYVETGLDLVSNQAYFSIADEGPGIVEELRHRIFDPFFTTKKGGSGLGLATVAKIVAAHGGEIVVEPRLNKGVKFRVEIKRA